MIDATNNTSVELSVGDLSDLNIEDLVVHRLTPANEENKQYLESMMIGHGMQEMQASVPIPPCNCCSCCCCFCA